MRTPRAKGITFANARAFVRRRYGEEGWARVLAAMSADDRQIIDASVAVGWYDLALLFRLMRTMDAELGRGDLSLLADVGRYFAEEDLTGIHRMFLRLSNPGFMVKKGGEYWTRFYDAGTWTATSEGTTACATIRDLPIVDPAFCVYLEAYITRMFELSGAKGVHVAHLRCRARGDDACAFSGGWKG